ncbi:Uncharacterised protein [Vibrio cholerae]|nr:Uncharacterised protein [Vibrio cholerae]
MTINGVFPTAQVTLALYYWLRNHDWSMQYSYRNQCLSDEGSDQTESRSTYRGHFVSVLQ